MRQAVVLHHRLPGPTDSHFDWLLERAAGDDEEERALAAFRVDRFDTLFAPGVFQAARIQDHRRRYLTYEGRISDGRGTVERVASGRILEFDERPNLIDVRINWGDAVMVYRGRLGPQEGTWTFTAMLDERR
jgi:hypothetical protein